MKKLIDFDSLIKNSDINPIKIQIFMSTKQAGDDFDEYENNYSYTSLNPITIKAFVREISPEALVYKQYGLHEMGAKEIICEARFKNMFKNCNEVKISGNSYQVFKEAVGNRAVIQERPNNLLRVILMKNG